MPIVAESKMREVELETFKLLEGFRDGDHHICLLGLNSLQLSQAVDSSIGGVRRVAATERKGHKITMREFHWRILKTVTECLQNNLGLKFVSFVKGGFQQCHDMALDKNIKLINH